MVDVNNREGQCRGSGGLEPKPEEKEKVIENEREREKRIRTMNFSAVKPSESCERWMELRLRRSLFTSFKAFIFPLKEFVSKSLERERKE